MIDTHCHIDFSDFDLDRDDVLANMQKRGVTTIIVPSVAQQSWHKTIATCQRYSSCQLALGMHPIFIDQHQPHHLSELDTLITKHQPIAVGEIGLDCYRRELNREKQLNYFSKQLIIANDHSLPVIIHNRKAHDECINLLSEFTLRDSTQGGIIHAFNGSIQQAEKYIAMGFLLGFGGMTTYSRSSKLHKLLEQLPVSAIVLETDAPDMTGASHQGQRNSPEYLLEIATAVAQIKQIEVKTVIEQTSQNAQRMFSLPA